MTRRPAQEFAVVDASDKLTDAALHEPILAEGDEAAAFAGSTYKTAKGWKWSENEISQMYGSVYAEAKRRGLLRPEGDPPPP